MLGFVTDKLHIIYFIEHRNFMPYCKNASNYYESIHTMIGTTKDKNTRNYSFCRYFQRQCTYQIRDNYSKLNNELLRGRYVMSDISKMLIILQSRAAQNTIAIVLPLFWTTEVLPR